MQVQDVDTLGASDAIVVETYGKRLLVISNYWNDRGSTNIMSASYLWNDEQQRFSSSPFQYIATKGARTLEKIVIGNTPYVMVGNYFDSETQKFELRLDIKLQGHCSPTYTLFFSGKMLLSCGMINAFEGFKTCVSDYLIKN